MPKHVVQVPQTFQAFGRWQREGEAGARWLAALPDVVADLCSRWELRIDGEPKHGYNGLAVPVLRGGEPLVLKVNWPDELVEEQAQALRLWDGQGTVLLVESDSTAGALLLERLDDRRTLSGLPLERAMPIIGMLLRRLAIPAPTGHGYRTTAELASELRDSLRHRWEAAGRPFTTRQMDSAIGLAETLATTAPEVMVDSDLSYENVLAGGREPWLVIDPLVLVGDIEYQCGQLLWTRCDEMADAARLRWYLDTLVSAAALDPDQARAWAIVRAVDYCLWGLDAGFTEDPVRCRRIVAALL